MMYATSITITYMDCERAPCMAHPLQLPPERSVPCLSPCIDTMRCICHRCWTAWFLIGLVACICIRRRKLKTLTLYERRARA